MILREIDMTLDDPWDKVSQKLFSTAFREHPYRHPVIGHRQPFEALSSEDLRRYYQERYTPNNCVLVVAGDVSKKAFYESVEQHYGQYARRRLAPVYLPFEPTQLALRSEHIYTDVQMCHGALAFKIPSLDHSDAPLLDLLATLLGSGNSSILWQRLREERKLVHHIDVSSWNPGSIGLLWINYLCDPDKQSLVEAAIEEELQAVVQAGIEQKRLDKSIRQLVVAEINSRKTFSAQASRQALCEVVIGDLDYPKRYFQRIQEVDVKDLTVAIERYLIPHQSTRVSLNPREAEPSITVKNNSTKTGSSEFETIRLANGVRLLV